MNSINIKMKYYLLLAILLLGGTLAQAQNVLDQLATSPSVAFSLRLLKSSYTGPLVRIYVGTSYYDVYPDASTKNFSLSSKISAAIGSYNAAVSTPSANALSSIITAGTTNATVAIWYDQSGNSIHVLSNNPNAKIISSGSINTVNSQPTINFTGSNSFLVSSSTVNYSAQTLATINAVVQNVASTNYISGIISAGDNGGWGLCYDPTSTIKGYWVDASGDNGAFSNEFTNDMKVVTGYVGTVTNSTIYVNSSQKGTRVAKTIINGTNDKIYIGSRGNFAGRQFIGNISEVFMFPTSISNSDQSTLESSQSIFIPPTVTITSSASGSICAGTSVTFTATTTGLTTPSFQWYKNSTAISGATNATYTTTSLSNNDQISVQATPGYTAGSISTTGLIANFDAANYNTSSTRWNDQSSSANHMDLYTDRTYSTLKTATYSTEGGGSLNVNNNSVFGKTINNTGIIGNGGKTMSAWVKFDATDVDWASVASIGEYAAGKLFEIYAQRNGTNSQLIFHWSGSQLSNYADLPKNTWYYVTIKSDGSSVNYIYINGIQVAYATQALNITNSPLYMGAPKTYGAQGGWDNNLRGKISTLSLYNTALSAQTILDNYNATKGRYTTTSIVSNTITTTITAGPTVSLTLTGDACVNKSSLSATTGLSSYTWYKDDAMISGATTNSYTPLAAGAYKVSASNGTCSTTSSATTINTCGVTADGKMVSVANAGALLSLEGGANFGTTMNEVGKIINNTGLTTVKGAIGATTAVISGVISATNALTSSIGVIYSTDANFGTSSTSTTQSNVAAGTYATTLTGLSATTSYYAKSFIVNKAGTSYGPVVNFTTSTPPVAVGDVYGGGIVFYVLQSGDAGYDANVQHGLIAATANQSNGVNWAKTASVTGATGTAIGTGLANTNLIISNQGNTGSYAAKIARDYTGGGYTDWYLPSAEELHKMVGLAALNLSTYYHSSTEYNSSNAIYEGLTIGDFYRTPGTGSYPSGTTKTGNPLNVRAIRSF